MLVQRQKLQENFDSKCTKGPGCWAWKASKTKQGYLEIERGNHGKR